MRQLHRVRFPIARALSVAALGIVPVVAQAGPARVPAQRVLRVSTSDEDLAWTIASWLPGDSPEDPGLGHGEHLVLTYWSDHRQDMAAVKRGAEAPVFELHAKPGAVKDAMKQQAGLLGRFARYHLFSTFVVGLRAEPRYVARAMKGVTDFPFQLETIDLVVRPRRDGFAGQRIDVHLLPRVGTWLQRTLAGLHRSSRGAHLLRTPTATLSLAVAVEGPALQQLIEPFAESLASLRGNSKAERKAFRAFVRQRLPLFDGSFSILVDGPGRYVRLVGLGDPERYRELADTAIGSRFDARRLGRIDVELAPRQPDAVVDTPLQMVLKEHDVLELLAPVGDLGLATFVGLIGDFSVKTRSPEAGVEAARLASRIARGHLRRLPFPDGALVLAEVHLSPDRLRHRERILAIGDRLILAFGGRRTVEKVLDSIPQHIELSVHKVQRAGRDALHLRILTRPGR